MRKFNLKIILIITCALLIFLLLSVPEYGGIYVSVDGTGVYHMTGCGAYEHTKGDRIYFNDSSEAEENGLIICGVCSQKIDAYNHYDISMAEKPAFSKGYVTGYLKGYELASVFSNTSRTHQEISSLVACFSVGTLSFFVGRRHNKKTIKQAEYKKKINLKNILLNAGITIAYWALLFFGPALIMLWNYFSYVLTGAGYGQQSLMYKILQFVSQPLSCLLAFYVATSLKTNAKNLTVFVNCIISAILLAFMSCAGFAVGNILNFWQMVASCIISAATAVFAFKDIKNATVICEGTEIGSE